MAWPEQTQEGFALAAAAHDDPGAALGARGLCPMVTANATGVALRLWSGDRHARRTWVRHMLTRKPRLGAAPPGCPPRALGWLAAEVDRELGRTWLAQSPLPRPGFAPHPTLLAHLRTLVQPGHDGGS